jgi:hypothetical protein
MVRVHWAQEAALLAIHVHELMAVINSDAFEHSRKRSVPLSFSSYPAYQQRLLQVCSGKTVQFRFV